MDENTIDTNDSEWSDKVSRLRRSRCIVVPITTDTPPVTAHVTADPNMSEEVAEALDEMIRLATRWFTKDDPAS